LFHSNFSTNIMLKFHAAGWLLQLRWLIVEHVHKTTMKNKLIIMINNHIFHFFQHVIENHSFSVSVSVRQWFVCAKVTNLIILVRYQRVTYR